MLTQIELIRKYNLSIRGNSGQHLLIDPNIQRKIVELVRLSSADTVLEIGPGLGALTHLILESGAKVVAVEKDGEFVKILEAEFGDYKNFKVVHEDILQYDLKKITKSKTKKIKVIGNLPYYITAPILFHLLEYRGMISEAVFTVQKEVADRLVAVPGNKNYGRLTLGIRYYADVTQAFNISKSCFTPKPEVDSSAVYLQFHNKEEKNKKVNEKKLFQLIQAAFGQRRKTLLSILSKHPEYKIDRSKAILIFKKLGFLETVRGEELLLKDYLDLQSALSKKGE